MSLAENMILKELCICIAEYGLLQIDSKMLLAVTLGDISLSSKG